MLNLMGHIPRTPIQQRGDDNGAYILKYSDGFWTIVGSLSQEQLKEKGLLK